MDLLRVQLRIGFMRSMVIALVPSLVAVLLAACGSTKSNPSMRFQRLLDGDGIGSVKFGESPAVVAARLGRLFGPPVGAKQIPHGYIRDVCGFYSEVWDGLGAASDGRFFVAQLTAWFRNSRFVGYNDSPNNFQTKLSSWSQYASHPMKLATAKGLAVGDALARGRRLYGQAFVVTTHLQGTPPNPRLMRLPVWEASTPSGRLAGGIGLTNLEGGAPGTSNYTSSHQSIVGIGAGVGPNTPC